VTPVSVITDHDITHKCVTDMISSMTIVMSHVTTRSAADNGFFTSASSQLSVILIAPEDRALIEALWHALLVRAPEVIADRLSDERRHG